MATLKKVQRGEVLTAEKINQLIDAIQECQIQSVVGGYFKRGPGGSTITISPQIRSTAVATQTSCPFDVTGSTISPSGLLLSLRPGMVNGMVPSNIFNSITTTTSGYKYVVVNCQSDGKNVVSASWDVVTSIPTPPASSANVAPTTFGVVVAAVSGSEIYKTIPCGNVIARVSPSIQADAITYTAGARNYIQYYTWIF